MVDQLREDYVTLFKHNALRGSVSHLHHELYNAIPAPDCILPELFGVGVIQTCTITVDVDPRPWIVKFIGMFEKAERGTHIVRSVTLLNERFDKATPLPYSFEPLGYPTRTGIPTPHNAFIKKWSEDEDTATESAVADLYVFENAKSGRKLEVLMWTIRTVEQAEALHYVFLLRVVDM